MQRFMNRLETKISLISSFFFHFQTKLTRSSIVCARRNVGFAHVSIRLRATMFKGLSIYRIHRKCVENNEKNERMLFYLSRKLSTLRRFVSEPSIDTTFTFNLNRSMNDLKQQHCLEGKIFRFVFLHVENLMLDESIVFSTYQFEFVR